MILVPNVIGVPSGAGEVARSADTPWLPGEVGLAASDRLGEVDSRRPESSDWDPQATISSTNANKLTRAKILLTNILLNTPV